MSNTISGGISFSGIGSGTDFASMLEQLVEVESMKLYSLEDSRTDATEVYDAFTDLIDVVRESQEALAALNSPSKFLTKLASSSNESVLSAKADANAVDGTHTIDIKQLASNAIWANKGTYAEKTTVINSSGTAQEFSYTYEGVTRTLNVPAGTTLEGFVNMVNQDKANPGVKMSIIQTADGYTFQTAGTKSGKDATLTIHPSSLMGMSGTGSQWLAGGTTSTTALNASEPALDTYTYFIGLQDGTTFSINNISGDTSQEELRDAINAAYLALPTSSGSDIAHINPEGDTLTIDDMAFVDRRGASMTGNEKVYANAPTTEFTMSGDLSAVVNTTTQTYTFVNYRNENVEVTVEGEHTQADILTELGLAGYTVSGTTAEDGSSTTLSVTGLKDISAITNTDPTATVTQTWDPSFSASITSVDTPIQSGVLPDTVDFTFELGDGTSQVITVNKTSSMQDVYTALETAVPGTVTYTDGVANLNNVVSIGTTPPGLQPSGGVNGSDAWAVQNAQDAEFYIDNWPQLLTSSSNEVTNVLEGVTLTLKDEEKVQITIASDTESVKANIQTFLDSINSVIAKMQDLTDVTAEPTDSYTDEGVGTTTSGPLTGNYSINLFSSRLSTVVTQNPPGFQPVTGNDVFSGDFVSSLAQIGIKIVTDESDPNHGLFAIAPAGMTDEMQAIDQKLFDDAIANNLEDVIAFFSNDGLGRSSSANFRYTNHIEGMTQYGTYDVAYTIAADGTAEVFIDGQRAAPSDVTPNTYTVGSEGGAAAGMSITIDNLAPGSYTGSVSIQQGKVGQLEDFFEAELKYYPPSLSDPSIGDDNGGLMIAQNSYKDLIASIDEKMSDEIDRLDRWEETQRLKFARLDTLLGDYDSKMTVLNQQLAQLV